MWQISALPVFNYSPIDFQINQFLEVAIDFLKSLIFERRISLALTWIHLRELGRFENWVENGGVEVFRVQILLQIDNFDGLIWRQNVQKAFALISSRIHSLSENVFSVVDTTFEVVDGAGRHILPILVHLW